MMNEYMIDDTPINSGLKAEIAQTLSIPNTMTKTQIQALIDALDKYIPAGTTITLQFSNATVKHFSADIAVDNTTALAGTVSLPIAAHGFIAGDIVEINGTTNYNNKYTLGPQTGGDANHLIVARSPFVAETFTTAAIARKSQALSAALTFQGFFGGGNIIIQGDTSETDGDALHATQECCLDFSASAIDGIKLVNCNCNITIANLLIRYDASVAKSGILISSCSGDIIVKYCYVVGSDDTNGSGIRIYSSQALLNRNYIGAAKYGIHSEQAASVNAEENDDYSTQPVYGLCAQSAIIFKTGNQPAGSTAGETELNGGQIF